MKFLGPTRRVSRVSPALKFAYVVVICELLSVAIVRYRFITGRLAKTIV